MQFLKNLKTTSLFIKPIQPPFSCITQNIQDPAVVFSVYFFHYYFYTLNFTWLILLQFLFYGLQGCVRYCKSVSIGFLFAQTPPGGMNQLTREEIMYLVKMLYISITETGLALAFWLDIQWRRRVRSVSQKKNLYLAKVSLRNWQHYSKFIIHSTWRYWDHFVLWDRKSLTNFSFIQFVLLLPAFACAKHQISELWSCTVFVGGEM